MKNLKNKLASEAQKIADEVKTMGDFTSSQLDKLHKIAGALFYMGGVSSKNTIADELGGSEYYLNEYIKTMEEYCMEIAKDKLKAAKLLLDRMPDSMAEKASLMDWYADIDSKLLAYKTIRL